jgi:hypothetical protein
MLIETSDGFQTIASRKATGITPWIANTCNVIECLGVGIEPRIEKAQQGFPASVRHSAYRPEAANFKVMDIDLIISLTQVSSSHQESHG